MNQSASKQNFDTGLVHRFKYFMAIRDFARAQSLLNKAQSEAYPKSLVSSLAYQLGLATADKAGSDPVSFDYHASESKFGRACNSHSKRAIHQELCSEAVVNIKSALLSGGISVDENILIDAVWDVLSLEPFPTHQLEIPISLVKILKAAGLRVDNLVISIEKYVAANPDVSSAIDSRLCVSGVDHLIRNGIPEMIAGTRQSVFSLSHKTSKVLPVLVLTDFISTEHLTPAQQVDPLFDYAFMCPGNLLVHSEGHALGIAEYLYKLCINDNRIVIVLGNSQPRPELHAFISDCVLGTVLYGQPVCSEKHGINRPYSYSDSLLGNIVGKSFLCHPKDLLDALTSLSEYSTPEGLFRGMIFNMFHNGADINLKDCSFYQEDEVSTPASTMDVGPWSPFATTTIKSVNYMLPVPPDQLYICKQHLISRNDPDLVMHESKVQLSAQQKATVGIIIPFRDQAGLLKMCIESILRSQEDVSLQILAIDNGSIQAETHQLIQQLRSRYSSDLIRIIHWNKPFNFSELNNIGAKELSTDYLLFVNNDIVFDGNKPVTHLLANHLFFGSTITGALLKYPKGKIQHNGLATTPFSHIAVVSPFRLHELSESKTHAEIDGFSSRLLKSHECSAVTAACMLVNKITFLECGGFDESLSVAYNDVELCLRMKKHFPADPIICVNDIDIRHLESETRGSDLGQARNARLHRERVYLCNNYPEILTKTDPFFSYPMCDDSGLEKNTFDFSGRPKISMEILYSWKNSARPDKDIATVFVHYDPAGDISANCLRYIDDLSNLSDVYFVSNSEKLSHSMESHLDLQDFCKEIIVRGNNGYDIGAWAHVINSEYEKLCNYKSVLLCNDSVVYGFSGIKPFFAQALESDLDFLGMTASRMPLWHVQSFFVFYKQSLFKSLFFKEHWANIRLMPSKYDIIMNYEVSWSQALIRNGYRGGAFFDRLVSFENPTHILWKDLLNEGFPFVKRELIRDNPLLCDLTSLRDIAKSISSTLVDDLDRISSVHRRAEWASMT
jgi:GT2 family glycosyltransferase